MTCLLMLLVSLCFIFIPTAVTGYCHTNRIPNKQYVLRTRLSQQIAEDDDNNKNNSKDKSHDGLGNLRLSRREFTTLSALLNTHLLTNTQSANAKQNFDDATFTNKNIAKNGNAIVPNNINNNSINQPSLLVPLPFSTVRRYKQVTLGNGIKVILVSDKRAFLAQVALSVGGAGQFADPKDLPGLAHLMEHIILSNIVVPFEPPTASVATAALASATIPSVLLSLKSNAWTTQGRKRQQDQQQQSVDFEDWLSERDGASNGFTAYDLAAFHFTCSETVLDEALMRFARLFVQSNVEQNCRNAQVLRREIRRVDSELDLDNLASQLLYLSKSFVDLEHPYTRLSAGNLFTLERNPKVTDVNVGERLIDFFRQNYQARDAVLVVIGRSDLATLEKMVEPFSNTMSNFEPTLTKRRDYIGGFIPENRSKQLLLYRGDNGDEANKLLISWILNLDYSTSQDAKNYFVNASQIGFLLSQLFSRRGPGSLYYFLKRRGWVISGTYGVPKVTLQVDVSKFQLFRLEFSLTPAGIKNRSAVVAAVYDCLRAVQQSTISRATFDQYAVIAKLHGYFLSPRPPDAVELAADAQVYGTSVVSTGGWYRYPTDRLPLQNLQKSYEQTIKHISDPSNALIVATVGSDLFKNQKNSPPINIMSDSIPTLKSPQWLREPTTDAFFCFDDMFKPRSRIEEIILNQLVADEELLAPVFNPLVPTVIRPARQPYFTGSFPRGSSWSELIVNRPDLGLSHATNQKVQPKNTSKNWVVLDSQPGQRGIILPRMPPEPSCRCAFVVQLLSSRPARANVRQGSQAELWKLSFDSAIHDLAESGIPAALAYDISFNKYGIRLAFLGISQNIGSYARRICRRLVQHSLRLLEGPEIFPSSITSTATRYAEKMPGLSTYRRRVMVSNLRRSTAYEAAAEGVAFLRSCSGAVCYGQGDLLQSEIQDLLGDVETIFADSINNRPSSQTMIPLIEDIDYPPMWKPAAASICSISGSGLLIDACGRLPR